MTDEFPFSCAHEGCPEVFKTMKDLADHAVAEHSDSDSTETKQPNRRIMGRGPKKGK